MTQEDLNEISNASKMHMPYGPKHDRNKAALSIQKKFRGWKGRKNFLTVRQHVVKLQVLIHFNFLFLKHWMLLKSSNLM